jgi:iron complex transport system permease protein
MPQPWTRLSCRGLETLVPASRERGATRFLFPALTLLLVLAAGASLLLGRYPAPGLISPGAVAADPLGMRLLLNLRLPRVLMDIILGCALGAAGTVFQMIFSNPLVEPGFLGVSPGAAFGAALCIVTVTRHPAAVEAGALVFALAGLFASWGLARLIRYGGWVLRLVLAGIAVSAVFSAGIGLVKMAADPLSQLPDITFWLLGSLSAVGWKGVTFAGPPAAAGLVVVFLYRWKLNVLSLDERVAHSLGSSPGRERSLLLFCATLATASAVSVTGLVGWVGLMAPHAARRITGADAARSLPGSLLLGAIFVLLCDDVARTVLPSEIPLGILTALLGAAGFLALMAARRRERGG